MGFRDFIKTISPAWLQDDSPNPYGIGGKFMYNFGLSVDAQLDKLNQAVHAWMPTLADPSALPYIGADRLIVRGLTQTDQGYATHLQQAFDDWQIAGTGWSVLRECLEYVSPPTLPAPYAYAVMPVYILSRTDHVYEVLDVTAFNYYDTATSMMSSQFLFPSSDTSRPPRWVDTSNVPDWDSLSQGTIGYSPYTALGAGIPELENRWRWLLFLSGCFNQFGSYITGLSNTTPITVTTAFPHTLSTGAVVSIGGVLAVLSFVAVLSNSGGLIQVTIPSHGLATGNHVLVQTAGNMDPSAGNWTVTVTGANTFTLDGSIYSAAVGSGLPVYAVFPESTWTITSTGTNTFTLNGSTASGPLTSAVQYAGRVYQTAANTWVDKAPFVFGTPGVKIGQRPDASIGLNQPADVIKTLRNIVDLWKSAESFCQWMTISLSPALFTFSYSLYPDGRFGRWSKIFQNQYIPSRFPNARYCSGVE